MTSLSKKICLVGHPYAPTGRGEDVRCTYRALRSVAVKPLLKDIYGLIAPGADEEIEFSRVHSESPCDINIFHINGDEVDQSLAHISYSRPWTGYNIIYPTWELSKYPNAWAKQLDRFAEIWAPSRFIQEALQTVCAKPIIYMPLACEVVLSSFLSRRYFGIPETEYSFLFFFDVRSYIKRKNPQSVIEAFRRLIQKRPFVKTRLILKVNGAESDPSVVSLLREQLRDLDHYITIIHRVMSDNEIKNLVRCCDCFISLHRSEGFGRGIAEAMVLGKPVIATGYSGNTDFMNDLVAYNVSYKMIALANGDYPHYQDQLWAEPDIEQASHYMAALLDDPESGRDIGRKARLHMKLKSSYRVLGLRYREHLEKVLDAAS